MSRKVDPEFAKHRSRLAVATRQGDEETAEEAREAMNLAHRVAKAEEHIQALVAGFPAPTPEQVERLVSLLRPKRGK